MAARGRFRPNQWVVLMHCFNRRSTIALVASLLVGSGSAAFAQAGNLGSTDKPLYLNQAWSSAERNWFYATSQGSQIMPYDWFMALEQSDSELAFRDSLQRFGYLPTPSKFNNPDGLPVGFVKDADDRGDWVGLTCAACHTNQVNF